MRFPLLWIAAACLAGLTWSPRQHFLPVLLAGTAATLAAGLLLLRARRTRGSWILSLGAWFLLGAVGPAIETACRPPQLIADASLALQAAPQALRWRGRLRSNPVALPWGERYEIELEQVDWAGAPQTVNGGLRVNYYRDPTRPLSALVLQAGDRVEALVRARPPRNYLNPGSFDARAHLARQGIHLTATLRSAELLRRLDAPPPAWSYDAARLRGRLLARLDRMLVAQPDHAAVLRAILLGDYSFIDHELAVQFQKTAAYHVLVISGMHVAALAAFVFWLGRRLRFPLALTVLLTLVVLGSYVAVVEDRPPIARAAWMSIMLLAATLLFRRVDLLNSIAAAALLMLVLRPSSAWDPSFQLSFLAGLMIAALALPWMERSSAPWRAALRHLSDITRDAAHPPRVTQFRLDLRAASAWLAVRLPRWGQRRAAGLLTAPWRLALGLWDVLLVSCVIQFGMLPLLALYFHRISLIGLLANVPAALLSTLLIPAGFTALAADVVAPPLGAAAATVVHGITAALLGVVTWFAHFPAGSYRIPAPPLWLVALFFFLLVAVAWAARLPARRGLAYLLLALPCTVATAAVALHPFAPSLAPGRLELTALDVGQGDALFLAFPAGQTMLVDGGGQFGAARAGGFRTGLDLGEQVVSPYLWSRGLQHLDVVALSHAHQDHLEGLFAVLDNFTVRELWLGRVARGAAFDALVAKARAHGVRVVWRHAGDEFHFAPVRGRVLWPEATAAAAPAASAGSNNDSLVMRLQFGAHALLLPGDIEAGAERALFARGEPLSADVLKIAHHGSRTSTTGDFLLSVLPQVAVISLGENNPFGHPHAEVLAALRATGTRLLRTDLGGAVTLQSDGKELRVTTFVSQGRGSPLPRSTSK
jgi:competence protein ComEC